MLKFILSVIVTILAATALSAQQIDIKLKDRIENCGNGYCGHCCIETIMRHYNMTDEYGYVARLLKRDGPDGGLLTDAGACRAIDRLHLHYFYYQATRKDKDKTAWLYWACENKYPVIVGLKPLTLFGYGHFVTLTGFYSDYVAVVDSNEPEEIVWYTREEFDRMWYGDLIIIYPPTQIEIGVTENGIFHRTGLQFNNSNRFYNLCSTIR